MRRSFYRGDEAWELASGLDAAAGEPLRFADAPAAAAFLRRLAAVEGVAPLRSFLAAAAPLAVARMGDGEVVAALAARLASGAVRAGWRRLPPGPAVVPSGGGSASQELTPAQLEDAVAASRGTTPGAGQPPPASAAQAQPQGQTAAPAAAQTTWIEVQLIGEDGQPVPGVSYAITLPDGTKREGTLDDQGLVRLDGIPAGSCQVSFPALDQDAWIAV